MNLTLAVYQSRDASGTFRWITLGLGPHTRGREGRSTVKLQQKLVEDLRGIIGELPVRDLTWFQFPRGLRLERIQLELDFKRVHTAAETRRLSGVFPLILEPRFRTRGELMTIAYHPARQDEWFPVDPGASLEEQAKLFFTRSWARLEPYQHESLRSNRKDSLKALAFVARPRSLLDELGKKKGPWDDLELKDPAGKKKKPSGGNQVLHNLGTNLTLQAAEGSLETGMPRVPYREQLQLLLGGERRTPVLLVGPPGAGKRTLLKRFVADQLDADGFQTHRNLDKVTEVWSIAGKRIIAGMSYVGDWEQRCQKLLEDARGGRRILFVEDLHAFGRIGRSRDSDTHLALFFQGALSRGEITLVGTVTPEQLQRLESDAPSFAALFTQLHVRPTSTDETLRMLLHEARELEARQHVSWSPSLFPILLEQASTLFPGAALPGKAIDLLRELATDRGAQGPEIGIDDLFTHLARKTGLPDFLLHPQAKLDPEDVQEALSRKVMGQPKAVQEACDLIARIHSGLTDPRRPYGVYLFTGPTGTGKTELTRALASYLYGDASRLVRLDMAEFQTADAVARLTGDVFQPEGRLTRLIREQPFSLVLLDEIEKAHPSLLNLLLQTFDEGRLTDASGETADFTHTVIVMTSNLGARRKPAVGIGEPDARALALDADRAVREFFPPELFNRIDRIVHFSPLSREAGEKVVEKELARLLSRHGLTSRNIFVSADEAVKRRIVEESFDAHLGARPLKRYLEEKVGQALSEAIIGGPQALMRLFQLYTREGGFAVQADALVPREPAVEGFALEPLLSLPVAKLREKMIEARDEVQRMRLSTDLGALSEQVRFHLERLQAGDREHAASLYTLDSMRMFLEEFAAQLESFARAPEDEARELIEVERFGVMERAVHDDYKGGVDRIRIFDRRALAPAKVVSREQMLDALAEVYFLQRILRGLSSPAQHVVTLELLPLGQWRQGAAEGSLLTEWLCEAYAGSRGEIEGFAAHLPGGARVSGGLRQLREFLHASLLEPVHVALKLVGPGIRPFFEGEAGLHVWQSSGRLPEIVKVRVHEENAPEPVRLLELHEAKLRAFHKARQEGASPLPEDPESAAPVVRAYRFEPPSRQGTVSVMEIDDYLLTYSGSHRVKHLADALPTLWRLRMSQNP
ncbi:ATP-dependent Clp protease ATP-binding subunit [Archangium violaceum]|uniref:AAA family ATPase n=1 Tax=Archangium violaceum TaxID=83451 RepID=UPI0019506B1A|nr:AAA family ATPase [Archangium violaceum]QRN92932.1 ATP-dependent Clp protease ATP-binding subunit [Archangium violaceum]